IEKRSKSMKQKHDAETNATASRHEEEGDDMFMQVQVHLRGQSNREAREKAMLETLGRSHKDEVTCQAERQSAEEAAFRDVAAMEAKALEYSHCAQVGQIENANQLTTVD